MVERYHYEVDASALHAYEQQKQIGKDIKDKISLAAVRYDIDSNWNDPAFRDYIKNAYVMSGLFGMVKMVGLNRKKFEKDKKHSFCDEEMNLFHRITNFVCCGNSKNKKNTQILIDFKCFFILFYGSNLLHHNDIIIHILLVKSSHFLFIFYILHNIYHGCYPKNALCY